MDSDSHLAALVALLEELDDWRDYKESEGWREHFPEPIWGDKHPPHTPHPVWLAVVSVKAFYRKNRLPHEIIDAWSDLCHYSRQHGEEDPVTQRDHAIENGETLRDWVVKGISRIEAGNAAHCDDERRMARGQREATHSTDFRSVRWFGARYSFTANQAPVVRLLYENWIAGTPDVGDETLVQAVDHTAPPSRLSNLFRGHPAWGAMIMQGGTKGTHRLAEPAERNT